MKTILNFILTSFIIYGCVEKEELCCGIPETNQLKGTWLLYEYGYSDGADLITQQVPADPPQTVTFADRGLLTTIDGWERFKYYQIMNDSVNGDYLALYVGDPGYVNNPGADPPTYNFEVENKILTLYFRWCTEGCYCALRKIDSRK